MPCQPEFYLLVVAHPDDESMFFSPTLCSIENVHILCLSNGNYDGLGKTREVELVRAAEVLGISPIRNHITCLNVDQFRDGPKEVWKAVDISCAVWAEISRILQQSVPTNTKSATAPKDRSGCNVAIITFDEAGVSGHPNHVDVCKGLRHMASNDRSRRLHDNVNVSICVWELNSITNPLTKYCPLIEWLPILIGYLWRIIYSFKGSSLASNSPGDGGSCSRSKSLHYIEAPTAQSASTTWNCRMFRPLLIWGAMAAHHSQFVWYRRLSVLFSRFSYRNTLKLHVPEDWVENIKKSLKRE
jgi:N-acetylglucosaminylphosphatidylinositol deacetylase